VGPRTAHRTQGEAGYTVFNTPQNYYCFLNNFELCSLPVILHMGTLTQYIEEPQRWLKILGSSTLMKGARSMIDSFLYFLILGNFCMSLESPHLCFLTAVAYVLWIHEFPFPVLKPKAQENNRVTHQGKPVRKECTMKTTSPVTALQLLCSNISHSKIYIQFIYLWTDKY